MREGYDEAGNGEGETEPCLDTVCLARTHGETEGVSLAMLKLPYVGEHR
jgi:hypothetical protein